MYILSTKHSFNVPIDAENIIPDTFADNSVNDIKKLKIWEGNREKVLGDLFIIKREKDNRNGNTSIKILGDLTKVKRIGAEMTYGEIIIEGDVGMRLGEEMRDGTITVNGNAGSWVGTMMKGGNIEITGNAGDYVGSAYRGSTAGMAGGKIIIHGNAGNEVGCFMVDGLIKIHGNVELFLGMHMSGGTIFVEGNSEGRMGAQMTRGKIVVEGKVPSVLPSFIVDAIRENVKVDKDRVKGPFYLFKGDITESWKGSLYISTAKNPHLSFYQSKIV